ncbi:MAG: FG-GAP-like repeat-containing protein [Fulvivirga sp.]
MSRFIVFLFFIIFFQNALSQSYSETDIGIPQLDFESYDFADFDDDGDIDILTTERGNGAIGRMSIYINDNGTYSNSGIFLPNIEGDAKWGDFNNDGFLDIAAAGYLDGFMTTTTIILINNTDNTFDTFLEYTDINVVLPFISWIDLNNDNYLDLTIFGEGQDMSLIYYAEVLSNNNGLGFSRQANPGIAPVGQPSVNWGDYDNDGDPDLVIGGFNFSTEIDYSTSIFTNNGDFTFTELSSNLLGLVNGTTLWFDYDRDNDLDILSTGRNIENIAFTKLYENENGSFTDNGLADSLNLTPVGDNFPAGVVLTDFDNDSDLDIFLSGRGGSVRGVVQVTEIYENTSDTNFIEADNLNLEQEILNNVFFFDQDNDGDKDYFYAAKFRFAKFNQNTNGSNAFSTNTDPTPPSILINETSPDGVKLSWNRGEDNETNASGLSYNYYLGTGPGSTDIVSPMSDLSDGLRTVFNRGNARDTSVFVELNQEGFIYWGVQSIDDGLAGSIFSNEQEFYFINGTVAETEVLNEPLQIQINWSDNSDLEDEYIVEKSTNNIDFETLANLPANSTSYLDDEILPDTGYFYRILAKNTITTSTVAAAYVVTLIAPTDLEIDFDNGNSVLSWSDNSQLEDFYTIQRKRSTVASFSTLPSIAPNSSNYTDSVFTSEGFFDYRVFAENEFGRSNTSDTVRSEYIFKPELIDISIEEEATAFAITWIDNSDNELGYSIRESFDNENFTEVSTTAANTTEFLYSSVQPERQYYFTIEALGVINNSAKDSITAVIPESPSVLEVNFDNNQNFVLEWQDNSNFELSYVIERRYESESAFVSIDTVDQNMTQFIDSEALQEGTYFYRIYALNQFGRSDYSNTTEVIKLFKPNINIAEIGNNPLAIAISWTDESTIEDSYVLERYMANGSLEETFSLEANSSEYLDEAVAPENEYLYVLYGLKENQSSLADSIIVSIPSTPTDLRISIQEEDQIRLSWNDNSQFETGYQIERRDPGNSSFQVIDIVDSSATAFIEKLSIINQSYSYRIAAINDFGRSDYSENLSIIVTSLTHDNDRDLTIFPNPVADGVLKVGPIAFNDNIEVSIIDYSGKTVINDNLLLTNDILQIDVKEIAEGNYILKLTSDDQTWNLFFIKK